MGAFAAIDVARTGIGMHQYWTEVISHNVANVNTVTTPGTEPFRQRMVVAQPNTDEITPSGSGVGVTGLALDETEAAITSDPGNPLADADGNVQMPVVDLAGQLADLMVAQRGLQASSKVIQSAREAYAAALKIGER